MTITLSILYVHNTLEHTYFQIRSDTYRYIFKAVVTI
jgi:hypothetical protein